MYFPLHESRFNSKHMYHIASTELWSSAVDLVPVGRFQGGITITWPPYRIPVPYSAALRAPHNPQGHCSQLEIVQASLTTPHSIPSLETGYYRISLGMLLFMRTELTILCPTCKERYCVFKQGLVWLKY